MIHEKSMKIEFYFYEKNQSKTWSMPYAHSHLMAISCAFCLPLCVLSLLFSVEQNADLGSVADSTIPCQTTALQRCRKPVAVPHCSTRCESSGQLSCCAPATTRYLRSLVLNWSYGSGEVNVISRANQHLQHDHDCDQALLLLKLFLL